MPPDLSTHDRPGGVVAPTVRRRVKDALRRLVLDHPFFGLLALRLRFEEDLSADTMWVDGVTLGYHPAYVSAQTDAVVQALICHEVLHVAAGHPWRRAAREAARWNRACDFAINPIVSDAGLALWEGALFDPAFAGLAAEAIYNRLPQPVADGGKNTDVTRRGDSVPGDDRASEGGAGADDGGDSPPASDEAPVAGEAPDRPSPSRTHLPAGEVRDAPQDRREELEAEWKMAVEAAAKAAGCLPGSLVPLIEQARKPQLDWRELLRAFVQQSVHSPDYRFSLPNPRYIGLGLYLPRLFGEAVGTVAIVVDTSASVSESLLEQFHGEIKAVIDEVRPEKTLVIYADTQLQGVAELFPDDAFRFEAKGRGGTSFSPAFDWVREKAVDPDCLIYLTDLEGAMPELPPHYPVLWVTPRTHLFPRWGQKVEIGSY